MTGGLLTTELAVSGTSFNKVPGAEGSICGEEGQEGSMRSLKCSRNWAD